MRKQWTSDCQVVIHVNLEASLQLQTKNVGSVSTWAFGPGVVSDIGRKLMWHLAV